MICYDLTARQVRSVNTTGKAGVRPGAERLIPCCWQGFASPQQWRKSPGRLQKIMVYARRSTKT